MELPKPIGILAANDDRGLQLLDACRRNQIAVPDQVAVLGVDNDDCLCDLSLPSLSRIDVNSEETGYQAAALLDRSLHKEIRKVQIDTARAYMGQRHQDGIE